MSRHDEIRASYKQLSYLGTLYDGIVTRSTLRSHPDPAHWLKSIFLLRRFGGAFFLFCQYFHIYLI